MAALGFRITLVFFVVNVDSLYNTSRIRAIDLGILSNYRCERSLLVMEARILEYVVGNSIQYPSKNYALLLSLCPKYEFVKAIKTIKL